MQKSPSKFHTLSFQFSKFYFFSIKFFINQPLVVAVTIFCFITFQFSPTALSEKKFTYSSCVNLVLCLSLNWVQFLYSKKATKPTLLALKTSLAFIIKPPENFIPTRKPKSLSQTGNPVVILKVSNHLNPHLSHIIIDPPRERKKKKN